MLALTVLHHKQIFVGSLMERLPFYVFVSTFPALFHPLLFQALATHDFTPKHPSFHSAFQNAAYLKQKFEATGTGIDKERFEDANSVVLDLHVSRTTYSHSCQIHVVWEISTFSVLKRHPFPVHLPPQKRLLTSSLLWSPMRGESCPRRLSTSVYRSHVLICVSRTSTACLLFFKKYLNVNHALQVCP